MQKKKNSRGWTVRVGGILLAVAIIAGMILPSLSSFSALAQEETSALDVNVTATQTENDDDEEQCSDDGSEPENTGESEEIKEDSALARESDDRNSEIESGEANGSNGSDVTETLLPTITALGTNGSNTDTVSSMIQSCAETRLAGFATTAPTIGTFGGDWTIMCLARSGLGNDTLYDSYYQAAVDKMQLKNGVLDKNKYSEYSRLILGLTAAGKDVTNVGGYNLLNYMADFKKIIKQGLNGPIWALIALDCYDYEIPQNLDGVTDENYNSRVRMVNYILDRQHTDGGWSLYCSNEAHLALASDPDMTGMAMSALYRYQTADSAKGIDSELAGRVSAALQKGLTCLSGMQKDSGDFSSYGAVNVESTVWVYMAMCCMNIDPLTDTRFIKNGITVIDAIQSYYTADVSYGAGFKHVQSGGWNDMATDQAMYGLVTYDRWRNGKSFFFDMRDVSLEKITDIALDQEKGYFAVNTASSVQLNVTVEPQGARVRKIDWKSSDETQAEVDANGLVQIHLTKKDDTNPCAVITCTVTDRDAEEWEEIYQVYSITSKYVNQVIQDELPSASEINSGNLNQLIAIEKTYAMLSDSEKEQLDASAKKKLADCEAQAAVLTHTVEAEVWTADGTISSASRKLKVESADQNYTLPWNAQLTVSSPDDEEALNMKKLAGEKTLLQLADISLTDILTGQAFELAEGQQVTVTMDVPYVDWSENEEVAVLHYAQTAQGDFSVKESITPSLSTDRQSVTFKTGDFSFFGYTVTSGSQSSDQKEDKKTESGTTAGSTTKITNGLNKKTSVLSGGEAKTLLEQSGLTLGQSDIQMVNITASGGVETKFETVKLTAAEIMAQYWKVIVPVGVGLLIAAGAVLWIIFAHRGGSVKKVNQHIRKRHQNKDDQ